MTGFYKFLINKPSNSHQEAIRLQGKETDVDQRNIKDDRGTVKFQVDSTRSIIPETRHYRDKRD